MLEESESKNCSAGSICLFGLRCGLCQTGSPDPQPPPPPTRHYQLLCSQGQNHLEPRTQPPLTFCSCFPPPAAWDTPRIEDLQQTLLESSRDPNTQACLLVVVTKESEAWLNALSVASLGLRLVVRLVTTRWAELQWACAWVCLSVCRTNASTVRQKWTTGALMALALISARDATHIMVP